MSLWNDVISAPDYIKERIFKQYGNDFPVEVRHFFADTIENYILADDITENDPGYENHALLFLEKLLSEMNGRIPEVDVMTQVRLTEAAKKFQQQLYGAAPLYTYLRNCLNHEKNLVYTNPDVINTMINMDSEHISTKEKLRELAQKVQFNGELNRKIIQEYERYAINYHNLTKANIQLEQEMGNEEQKQAVLKRRNAEIEYCFNKILEMVLQLETSFRETLEMFKTIFTQVLKFLNQWKERQSLSGNGARFVETLSNIQEYFEILADIIWTSKEQIKVAMQSRESLRPVQPNLCEYLPICLQDATNLLEVLIKNSFVIEKQPPQVMKTNTRFTATVRLLIGSKLNIHMTQNLVKVTIVSELQAQATQSSNKATEASSGEILNNTSNLEFSQPQKTLNANFRNMQLKKIKRAEKKGTESVMDEKFALLFQTNFTIGDFTFTVWALSLPVVVIVHGNQEPQSWATITWDNAFSQITRIPFQVPDKVPWQRLADALNTKFHSATEKDLSEMNLLFLCEKAFKQPIADPNQMEISWSQFCKEPIPDRAFTFWEWFFAIMKLTREHLRNLWKEGLIMGFVHKKQAEEMLMKCTPGTFLLRFSDSELGGVTIAWINDMGDGQKQIVMLQPFLAKDFGIRSLADRIHDLQQLTTLYPNIPKDQAFGQFYTPIPDPTNNGYVKPVLVIQLPRNEDHQSNYPGSHYVQSPEHTRDTSSVHSYSSAPIEMDIPAFNEFGYDNFDNTGLFYNK